MARGVLLRLMFMKPLFTRLFFRLGGVVLVASGTTACSSLNSSEAQPKTVQVVATAYGSGAKCNGKWANRNALGGTLKAGEVHSAAADWSRFPAGTKFRVQETGQLYEVDDYGSAMVGRDKVDLFKTDYRQVRRWGVRDVTLEILEWGCPQKSLAILRPRVSSRFTHVRRMVEDLESKLGDEIDETS
jgi:3D (Asp-Asp-Asp) domain-containing protein